MVCLVYVEHSTTRLRTTLLTLSLEKQAKRGGCCGVEMLDARGYSQSAIGSIVDGL